MNAYGRRTLGTVLATLALVAAGAAPSAGARAVHQGSTVYEFVGLDAVGHAALTRNASGLTMRASTAVGGQLVDFGGPLDAYWTTGDATTVWFIVFNDPTGCVGACGEDDVLAALGGNNRGKVGVHHAAGHVAGGAAFQAAGRLNEGDTGKLLFGMPLMDAMTAEVHLVFRSHGPASTLSGSELAAALHTVDGGCGINTCGDPQFAVFLTP